MTYWRTPVRTGPPAPLRQPASLRVATEGGRSVAGRHEEPIKVSLLFESKLAVYVTERQWHPTQEFKVLGDGRVELRLETTGRKELMRWVLSWMPDVKVLAPKSLHDRIYGKAPGWATGTGMRVGEPFDEPNYNS